MPLIEDIEQFCEDRLPIIPEKSAEHLIHDSVAGISELDDYEVEILDTPLLQRLRRIHQMAFAQLVYPTATHTRFEHTIGVTKQCALLAQELKKKKPRLIDDISIREIRLAALMHDTGHGIFSHSSEDYYRDYPEWKDTFKLNPDTQRSSPHEVLSSLIVQSKAFRRFFRSLEKKYEISLNLDEVSKCILGVSPKFQAYKAELINGPLDADKSDYLVRDAFNLGLPSAFRPDLLSHQIEMSWANDRWQLAIPLGSTDTIESLIFSKIMLFSSVYSHHALRSAECSFKGILDYCRESGISINNLSLNKVIDFLLLSEDDIIRVKETTKDSNLKKLTQRITERKLLKRALLLSRFTLKDPDSLKRLISFEKTKKRDIAKEIWHRANTPCLFQEIWLDAQPLPSFNSYNNLSVCLDDGTTVPFQQVFPITTFFDNYIQFKWRAYLFCPEECLEKVAIAGSQVLSEIGIEVKDSALVFKKVK